MWMRIRIIDAGLASGCEEYSELGRLQEAVREYAVTQPEKMPNFIRQQETSRYVGRIECRPICYGMIRDAGMETYLDLNETANRCRGRCGIRWVFVSGQFPAAWADFHSRYRAGFVFPGEILGPCRRGHHLSDRVRVRAISVNCIALVFLSLIECVTIPRL